MNRAIASLCDTMATDSRDWSLSRADAWIYGIVVGWEDALPDVVARHGWTLSEGERLANLHEEFEKARSSEL